MRASAGCSRPRVRCSRGRSTCSRTSSCGSSGERNGRRPGSEYEPTQVRRDPRGRPRVGVRPPVAEVARGRRVRGALVVGDGAAGPRDGVRELGAGRPRRVERRLTLFDAASDLCELNRRAGRKPMRVDRDLGAVLAHAGAFRRATGGAFDVAVEPLMRVWGFHEPRARATTAAELAEARAAVRAAVVELDGDVARLPGAQTQLDFGAIGVGYGIDRALEVLCAGGLRRAFIDVSGDMAAIGTPPGEPGWRVDIADPDQPGAGRAAATTRLRDAALATAANTESIVRYGSLVAGHVMDPKTGWPARALKQA